MTAEAELLRAVAADLDDRGAWQVYLDWLLEREDPRAELVRLQTSLEEVDDERERKAVDKQVHALLDRELAPLAGSEPPIQPAALVVRHGCRPVFPHSPTDR